MRPCLFVNDLRSNGAAGPSVKKLDSGWRRSRDFTRFQVLRGVISYPHGMFDTQNEGNGQRLLKSSASKECIDGNSQGFIVKSLDKPALSADWVQLSNNQKAALSA